MSRRRLLLRLEPEGGRGLAAPHAILGDDVELVGRGRQEALDPDASLVALHRHLTRAAEDTVCPGGEGGRGWLFWVVGEGG